MRSKMRRWIALGLSAAVCMTSAAGMVQAAEPLSEIPIGESQVQVAPLLSCDTDVIKVEDADMPIEAELTVTSEDVDIDGVIAAEDITLADAFRDMEVEDVTNDGKSITLKVSGKPDLTRDNYNVPILGTMQFAGKHFGSDRPVEASVVLEKPLGEASGEAAIFWPYFDGVLNNRDTWEMHVILFPMAGEFAEGFDESCISLGLDFEEAKITSLKENEGEYGLIISVPKDEETKTDFRYTGDISLKKGSMISANGEMNEEEISVTRSYQPETVGRDLTDADVTTIKNIVGGFGNTTFGTITGTLSGAASAGNAAWFVLGLCGVVPNDTSRHAEIMGGLSQIQGQLSEIQDSLVVMREILDQHTESLRKLGIKMDSYYLSDFNSKMINLINCMEKIEGALHSPENQIAIEAIVEEIENEYKIPLDMGRDMDPEELALLAAEGAGEEGEADDSAGGGTDAFNAESTDSLEGGDEEEFFYEDGEEFMEEEFEDYASDDSDLMPGGEEEATADGDAFDGLIEDGDAQDPEVSYVDKSLTEQECKQMLFKLAEKICALPQSVNFTIGDKVEQLEGLYNALLGYFISSGDGNPINAYVNLHAELDNFATTSMDAKILYEVDIRYQLERALNLLMVLDGVDAHEADRKDLNKCIWPDVTAGAVNSSGDPWCYVMNSYVRLSGNEIDTVYLPLKEKKTDKITFMNETDIGEYTKRMHGRTCREDLLAAGFTQAQLDADTAFQTADLQSIHKYNSPHVGLTFEYEVAGCKRGAIKFSHYFSEYYAWDKRKLFSHLGSVNEEGKPYMPDEIPDKYPDTFAVISRGFGWNETQPGGYSCDVSYVSYTNSRKSSDTCGYEGWAPRYPKHYLMKVGK